MDRDKFISHVFGAPGHGFPREDLDAIHAAILDNAGSILDALQATLRGEPFAWTDEPLAFLDIANEPRVAVVSRASVATLAAGSMGYPWPIADLARPFLLMVSHRFAVLFYRYSTPESVAHDDPALAFVQGQWIGEDGRERAIGSNGFHFNLSRRTASAA